MRVRRWAYRRGVLATHQAKAGGSVAVVPVISVGNLTAGGTGKTPMVALLVNHLRDSGHRPAVVMRGYKARQGRSDEAQLLEQLCGGPVVVNPDRVAGAAQAIAGGADVIVLDDGFQHRRLGRDLDIVLIDATDPFGLGHCLPRGLLREPLSALADAQAIVITRSDSLSGEALRRLRTRLAALAPSASIAVAVHRPLAAIDEKGQSVPVEQLRGQTFLAFCGIGNPQSFFDTLTGLGAVLAGTRAMGDHCEYGPGVLEGLAAAAGQLGCTRLITTQKDYVKIAGAAMALPVWQLAVGMELLEGKEGLLEQVDRAARQ